MSDIKITEMRFNPYKLKRLIAFHNFTSCEDGQSTLFTRELMEFIQSEHHLTALILIKTFAACDAIPDNVLCATLYTLGHYAETALEAEQELIIEFAAAVMIGHKNIEMRSAAIDCLGYVGTPNALRVLRAQLVSEEHEYLRNDIQQILDETDTNAH